jgi:tRNA U34 2-thiouridine synthase MnmA/TrmU
MKGCCKDMKGKMMQMMKEKESCCSEKDFEEMKSCCEDSDNSETKAD